MASEVVPGAPPTSDGAPGSHYSPSNSVVNGVPAASSPSTPPGPRLLAPSASSASSAHPHDRTFAVELHDHFDAVFKRVTMGRRDLKAVRAYFDARAASEKAYADKLTKDAGATPELTDSSSSIPVWSAVKESATAMAAHHTALSSLCLDLSKALKQTVDTLKSTKTSMQDRYTRIADECRTKQQRHDKAREQYADATKQAETAIQNRDHGRSQPQPQQQKLEAAVQKNMTTLSTRHEDYKRAVQVLKDAQVRYDAEVIDVMTQFERVEAERLRTFHDLLQRYTAGHDQLGQGDAAIAASLHRSMLTLDQRKDIQDFIAATTTNTRPRAHVEYHAINSAVIDGRTKPPAFQPGMQPPMQPGYPQPGMQPGMQPGVQPAMGSAPMAAAAVYSPTPGVSIGAPVPVVPVSNGAAAGIGGAKFIPPPPEQFVAPAHSAAGGGSVAVAIYDFESNESDDLTFHVGDVITLKACEDADDWWTGELRGRQGIFPKSYVRKEEAQLSAPAGVVVSTPAYSAPAPASYVAAPAAAQYPPPVASYAAPAPAPMAVVVPAYEPAIQPAVPGGGGGEGVAPAAGAAPGGGAGSPEQPREMDARCEALFDFVGQDVDELSFKKGDQLVITGELNGWYLGKIEHTNSVGIFPSNYVSVYPA